MARPKYPSDDLAQFMLRMPPDLRDRIKVYAERHGRSMNTEIVRRLENSFRGWPKITWSDDHFDRLKLAGEDRRQELEKRISDFAHQLVEHELPSVGSLHDTLCHSFYRLLHSVPEEERERLNDEFVKLSLDLIAATAKKAKE